MSTVLPDLVHQYVEDLRFLPTVNSPTLVWKNEAGGQTYRLGDLYLKWNPSGSNINLEREFHALTWIAGKHPAPRPVHYAHAAGNELLVTAAISGEPSHAQFGITHPRAAIISMALGLQKLHMIPIIDFPLDSTSRWYSQTAYEPNAGLPHVLVHGDACAPNTLIQHDGSYVGNVDFGDLGLGSMWADLAVGSLSLQWNFLDCGFTTREKEEIFFSAYGITPDKDRIAHYRKLWEKYS